MLIFCTDMVYILNRNIPYSQIGSKIFSYSNCNFYNCDKGLRPAQYYLDQCQSTLVAPAPKSHYNRHRNKAMAIHLQKRLDNSHKVMGNGPKPSSLGFGPGKEVLIQDAHAKVWDTHGTISERLGRQFYKIETDCGKFYVRNKKYLRHLTREGTNEDKLENWAGQLA